MFYASHLCEVSPLMWCSGQSKQLVFVQSGLLDLSSLRLNCRRELRSNREDCLLFPNLQLFPFLSQARLFKHGKREDLLQYGECPQVCHVMVVVWCFSRQPWLKKNWVELRWGCLVFAYEKGVIWNELH